MNCWHASCGPIAASFAPGGLIMLPSRALVTLAAAIAMAVIPNRSIAGDKSPASRKSLEVRIESLEEQNRTLQEQNRQILREISDQKTEIDALRQQIPESTRAQVADVRRELPKLEEKVAKIEKQQSDLPFEVGFRTGWSESPY